MIVILQEGAPGEQAPLVSNLFQPLDKFLEPDQLLCHTTPNLAHHKRLEQFQYPIKADLADEEQARLSVRAPEGRERPRR